MSLPATFFLLGALAVDAGADDASRRTAARVKASILSRDWSWIGEITPDAGLDVVQRLARWTLESPDLDALCVRLGAVLLSWANVRKLHWGYIRKIVLTDEYSKYDFPVMSAWEDAPDMGCQRIPAWPELLSTDLQAKFLSLDRDRSQGVYHVWSWDVASRRVLVSFMPHGAVEEPLPQIISLDVRDTP